MADYSKYNIDLNVLFGHQEHISIPKVVSGITDKWSNRTLTKVNDSVVRLAVIEGEFHWHKHDHDDEYFMVLEGKLLIDLEGQTIELGPLEGVTISRGVMHRPRAPQRTVVMLVETADIVPTGD